MKNFVYSIQTEVFFGKGQIKKLGNIVKKYGKKVLVVYGGGSIKKIGLYDEISRIFEENEIIFAELPGVEPNPRIESVKKGIEIAKKFDADVILAVGGGSTIDCAKVIAASIDYDNDPWDIVLDPKKIKNVLPIVTILTLAATGSEMDGFAVISNVETNDKLSLGHPKMKPSASIMDPEYTYSVSKYQTASGTADIMSHVFESYFSNVEGAYLQERFAESILKTCIEYGVKAVENPENYEARANLMWASSWAINGLISLGNPVGWSVHPMEHELSAYYDITHGVGLSILTPHWMKYILNDSTVKKFSTYGKNVWNIDSSLDDSEIANKAIEKTKEYFEKLGLPKTLREVGINEEKLEIMAQKSCKHLEGVFVPLTAKDVYNIFKRAL